MSLPPLTRQANKRDCLSPDSSPRKYCIVGKIGISMRFQQCQDIDSFSSARILIVSAVLGSLYCHWLFIYSRVSIATGQPAALGYSRRPIAARTVARIGRSLAFHIYIESALAGPFAQQQRLSFHSIRTLLHMLALRYSGFQQNLSSSQGLPAGK